MVKVSIIIPVYNTEKYLEECLACLLRQTMKEIELICVDDGSNDASGTILKRYAQKYPEVIKCIFQENSGQSIARNRALEMATGDYVYFMDSDDILLATTLEETYNICVKDKLDVLFFSGETFFESKSLAESRTDFNERYLRKGAYKSIVSGKQLLQELVENKDYIVSPCLSLVRREFLCINGIKFEEGIIHEDNLFCFEILIRAKKAFCVNEIYFYRRVREQSVMTCRESSRNLYGYWKCYVKQMQIIGHETWSDEHEKVLLSVLSGLIYHTKRIYEIISDEERDLFISKCDMYEKLLFKTLIVAHINELNQVRSGYRAICDDLQYQLNCVHSSVSLKVGRKITMIPRKIRTLIRVWKNNGWHCVVGIIKEQYLWGAKK